jgi:hypothetical protein
MKQKRRGTIDKVLRAIRNSDFYVEVPEVSLELGRHKKPTGRRVVVNAVLKSNGTWATE